MPNRIGRYTIELPSLPGILGSAAVAGKKEGEGPLATDFDYIYEDISLGVSSWEKAESLMQKDALQRAIGKAGITAAELDCVFAGDLLDQCIGSTFSLRELNIPFIGLFGACSTMALSLTMAGLFTDSGIASVCAAVTSSHYCSAERQFRFPLEYGGQRTPSSQWTVTGAGAAVVGGGGAPHIRQVTIGRIVDLGINDQNNMGGAMAPAAAETLKSFFTDTATGPDNYDLILTGDLGRIGSKLLYELLERENIRIQKKHQDCGILIFDENQEDVFAGGSGCGCSASVLCSNIINKMKQGRLNNVLFLATGALMSPTSVLQGETIPGIAHLVHLVA